MENPDDVSRQELEWAQLYALLGKSLSQFGRHGAFGEADYYLVDDNWGCRQHKLYISNLKMLSPHIVKVLQNDLTGFPDWEIIVAVDIASARELWPKMGLIIKAHEIIDGLQRQYFPKEYQNLKYQASRPGPVLNER